jgi:hypothetical protein
LSWCLAVLPNQSVHQYHWGNVQVQAVPIDEGGQGRGDTRAGASSGTKGRGDIRAEASSGTRGRETIIVTDSEVKVATGRQN